MQLQWNQTKAEPQARHILFQEEDKEHYVQQLFDSILK